MELIFSEDGEKPIQASKIQIAFKRLLEAAGLPRIRFHDMRHTAATQMLANGVDLLTVSKRLGHSKPSITLDIYAHSVPGLQEKAATIMDEITTPISFPEEIIAPKLHLRKRSSRIYFF